MCRFMERISHFEREKRPTPILRRRKLYGRFSDIDHLENSHFSHLLKERYSRLIEQMLETKLGDVAPNSVNWSYYNKFYNQVSNQVLYVSVP